MILTASACQKPDTKGLSTALEALSKDVNAIVRVPEVNRKERNWHNHLQVIAEGAPSVGWVGVVSEKALMLASNDDLEPP